MDHGRNYLRVRGEYNPARSTSQSEMELPPRARRIPNGALCTLKMKGTTSACAENTGGERGAGHTGWNYLRVRGEYSNLASSTVTCVELPPRARRIQMLDGEMVDARGTTSACAENTNSPYIVRFLVRNYLRVRGEYEFTPSSLVTSTELPPRARRIQPFGSSE